MSNPCAALLKKYCGCDGVIFESTAGCPHSPFRNLSGTSSNATTCDPATGQTLDAGAPESPSPPEGTKVEAKPGVEESIRDEVVWYRVRTLTGPPLQAALAHRSYGIVIDSQSNLFLTETLNHRILKITSNGEVSVFAGSTQGYRDGVGAAAQFYEPHGLTIDSKDNLYVTDTNNHRIRKVDPTGSVVTIAGNGVRGDTDGPAASAQFNEPQGIAVAQDGNLYIADTLNHRIRKIDSTGQVTTLAGSTQGYRDGQGSSAQFNFVFGLVIDDKNTLYVADAYNHRIRKVTTSGQVTTIAGIGTSGDTDGQGVAAAFNQPHGIALDPRGNLYIADMQNHRIRKLDPEGRVSTVAGSSQGLSDGVAQMAQFNKPYALIFAPSSNLLYVADTYNYRIRVLNLP